MMRHPLKHEIRTLDVSKKPLRSFGYLIGLVCLVLALVTAGHANWRPGPVSYGLGGLGGALLLLGWLAPHILRPVYRLWMAFALILGFVMTRVLLTVVFIGVITPIGLVLRLFRKDPLHRTIDTTAPSYWIAKEAVDTSPERMEKYY